MTMARPDVVYIVRKGDDNESLRYSLRSLKNIKHGKVFISGYKPNWVKNCTYLHVDQGPLKYKNGGLNIAKACKSGAVSENFLLMNDDFFIMRPITGDLPILYMGGLNMAIDLFTKISPESPYVEGMKNTREMLHTLGMQRLVCYETHTPLLINKRKWLELRDLRFDYFPQYDMIHMRTLYGNYYGIGGGQIKSRLKRINDVKIVNDSTPFSRYWKFISTTHSTFVNGRAGQFIRKSLSHKCEYEV